MLTFPLRYSFLPLSMRITSWIVKKSQPMLKKLSAKKLTPGDIFCPPRAFSYKSNKQIKLRWREVDHSLMAMLSAWKTV